MTKYEKLFQYVYVYYIFILTNFICGFIINILQLIIYLTIKPFNIDLFRKINFYLCYSFYSHMVFLAEWYADIEIYLYIDEKDKKYLGNEHAYVICNHKFEVDWLVMGVLSEKFHCIGNYKAYIKKIIQYVPATGWALYFSENIFLERNFDKDKQIIQKQITKIVNHPNPIWLFLFPEGTRFTPEKHATSLKIAKEKKLPELKYHLSPRTKGFVTSLPPMKGKMEAIYDVTITFNPYEKLLPTTENLLLGRKMQAHIILKRIPFNEVPEDEEEASKFLHNIFIRKDKLVESFLTTGGYFSTSGEKKIHGIKLNKSWFSFFNHIIWLFVIMGTIFYYLINLLFNGTFYNIISVSSFLFLFSFGLSLCFKMNETKKGSSYGIDTKKSHK